jgi:bifunctional ADP-heptose synthase (sugar kinase/adenylyltransferase)
LSLLSLNTIDALTPNNGHVLVVGDIWLDQQQLTSRNQAQDFFQSGQSAALGIALTLHSAQTPCTFVSYVGDDDLGSQVSDAVANVGVLGDLLAIKEWATYTNALDFIDKTDEADAPAVANMRRHKDEKIIPIDGFSEYQAHLQNRSEKYLLNASVIVVVDLNLGCIAEPRALNFVAKQRGVPIVAVVSEHARSRYEGFEFVVVATDADLLVNVANHVAGFVAATGQNQ